MRPALALALAALLGAAAWYVASGRGDSGREEASAPPRDAPGSALARQLEEQGRTHYEAGRFAESAEAYARAAEAALGAGDAMLARSLRAQSGIGLKMAGRTGEARQVMLETLADARAAGDRRTEGLVLGNLARIESLEGRSAEAVKRLDELVELAVDASDERLAVLTLEQSAAALLELERPRESLEHTERALTLDAALSAEDTRHDSLVGLKASARAALGDDEGAHALWSRLPASGASLANRARHQLTLGLPLQAAELALRSTQAFEAEGETRRASRDRAYLLHLEALLRAGALDEVEERIAPLLAGEARDPAALAPFRVLAGRLAIARGDPLGALEPLAAARAALAGAPEAADLALLAAAARQLGGQPAEAASVLEALPPSLARDALLAWALSAQPGEGAAISGRVPGLRAEAYDPRDESLERLRELSPVELPRLSWLALDSALADSGRAAEPEPALASALAAEGYVEALTWQAIEARGRVLGLATTPAQVAALAAAAEDWVEGRLPAGRAVLAVLPGPSGSYLLVCTPGAPAGSFTLPPDGSLRALAARLGAALHDTDVDAVAVAAHAWYSVLLPRGARDLVEALPSWTLVLPPELLAAPPALWVSRERLPGEPVPWLVLERVTALLPHVPLPRGELDPARSGWAAFAAPLLDAERIPLAGRQWLDAYGLAVLRGFAPRGVDGEHVLAGAEATVAALRELAPRLSGLRLSMPAVGCGRLGGLLLSASGEAVEGDEAAGLLPFHRLHEIDLPPALVVDGARFDPARAEGGVVDAATSILARSDDLIITRWPLSPPMRDAMVERILAACARGASPAQALASVQREYLQDVGSAGAGAQHPQIWAALLAFGWDPGALSPGDSSR